MQSKACLVCVALLNLVEPGCVALFTLTGLVVTCLCLVVLDLGMSGFETHSRAAYSDIVTIDELLRGDEDHESRLELSSN